MRESSLLMEMFVDLSRILLLWSYVLIILSKIVVTIVGKGNKDATLSALTGSKSIGNYDLISETTIYSCFYQYMLLLSDIYSCCYAREMNVLWRSGPSSI